MKFSLNFIRSFNKYNQTTGDVATIGVDKLIDKIGAQLGAIDEISRPGDKYKGLMIVKVVSCQKHPNGDKLSVCKLDNGKETVELVCGAPNVHEGMLAVWIPPGMVV